MAPNKTNCRHFGVVLSAIFILLSVSAVAEQQVEVHRCYWCGPLAEQVHRSQRASSCDGDNSKVTVCDDGLPYCAIVATSPPYVESRYCVKVYQDECYTVYCNTTKIWKVTCPCRGELCNGNNTKRESIAFQALLKNNIAKHTQSKRLKRALISMVSFIGMTTSKNKIDNATEETKDVPNEANSVLDDNNTTSAVSNSLPADPESTSEDSFTEEKHDMHIITNTRKSDKDSYNRNYKPDVSFETGTSTENSETETEIISYESSSEADTSNESSESESDTESASSESNEVNSFVKIKPILNDSNEHNTQIDIPSASFESEDLKTEIIVMSSELPKVTNDTNPNDHNMFYTSEILSTTTAVTKPVPIKNTEPQTNIDKTKPKPTEKLPAAEALQHDQTPTTKAAEKMTTNAHIDVHTTQTSVPRNNSAVRLDAHNILSAIVVGVILHY